MVALIRDAHSLAKARLPSKLHLGVKWGDHMKYELLYIVSSRYTDAEVLDIQKKINGLITQAGGTTTKEENLGKIRLAYPIKQARHGTYILVYFDAETSSVRALDEQLRLADEVLRHITILAPTGAEAQKWELQSYVAPLSEEESELKPVAPRPRAATAPVPMQVPVVAPMKSEKSMSIEELDKKLDEMLGSDDIMGNV